MKAEELRIGNIYKPDSFDRGENEHDFITVEDIVCLFDDPLDDFYKPIPLTGEWLVKFGFKDTWYGYQDSNIEIQKDEFNQGFILSINCNEYCYGECFKYVHQLQNLYFALTNQELTIK